MPVCATCETVPNAALYRDGVKGCADEQFQQIHLNVGHLVWHSC